MRSLELSNDALEHERERIVDFIRFQAAPDLKLVLGLSGGVDSDVTARLCARAVGPQRMKCLTVLQADAEPSHLENARHLAQDIGVSLVEIDLAPFPRQIIARIAQADPQIGFVSAAKSLDVGRGKGSLRTFVFAAYAEYGYLIVGPSVKTEWELGVFGPFADGIAHIRPIVHLYKTQVQQLAQVLGTRAEVISQPPSAGFWRGYEDLFGIAGRLYKAGPFTVLDEESETHIRQIYNQLSFRAIDQALMGLNQSWEPDEIAKHSNLPLSIIEGLQKVMGSHEFKRRELGQSLEPMAY